MKYSFEEMRDEALKYKTKGQFLAKSPKLYVSAYKAGLLDRICSHMSLRFTWSDETLQLEANKYTTRKSFQLGSPGGYTTARKRRLLDKICGHMLPSASKAYTLEEIQIEASKYSKRGDFAKNSPSIYMAAWTKKILNSVCLHMDKIYYCTKESALQEALKYNTRNSFKNGSPSEYSAARRMNLLEEVCHHMKKKSTVSVAERELLGVIKAIFLSARELKVRKIKIKNKPHIKGFDIDIFISDLSRGIEFDGTYYHSFNGLKRSRPNWPDEDLRNYHDLKDQYFATKGIRVLHIKEEEWKKDKEDCIKRCLIFLGVSP
jgi:hypothetical protein